MTIDQMHIAVKEELDKTTALELPAYEPEEIDDWLNKAIRRFVKLRYHAFEKTQKRIDDLRTLVVHMEQLAAAGNGDYPAGMKFALPTDYWLSLGEEASVVINTVPPSSKRVGVTECTIDEYTHQRTNPFSEHRWHYDSAKPLRIFNDTTIELIPEGGKYMIGGCYLSYLKAPAVVDLDTPTSCDLPEHTHDEIVKLAVSMMLENIEQPRYGTFQNEVTSIE